MDEIQKSPWITILSNPTRFFATRRERIGWVWIMVAYSVVVALAAAVEIPYVMKSAAFVHQLAVATAQNPAIAQTIKTGTEFGGPAAALFSVWGALFFGALVLWILTKLFGVQVYYMKVVGVLANASIIAIIAAVLSVIVTVATGSMTKAFLTLGMITSAGHIGGLLSGIGVFSLWALYLEIVGIAEMGKVSKAKASGPVVLLFVLTLLLQTALG